MKTPTFHLLFITLLSRLLLACQREKIENYPDGKLKSVQQFKGKNSTESQPGIMKTVKKQLEAEYSEDKLNGKSVQVACQWSKGIG
ncbi:MAG: hypothetical protein IPH20_24325 [Bacteroidales bacterium]|nr:hypothetical protein [Bacteroidales bacterium]